MTDTVKTMAKNVVLLIPDGNNYLRETANLSYEREIVPDTGTTILKYIAVSPKGKELF
jgi:hypothetical protein